MSWKGSGSQDLSSDFYWNLRSWTTVSCYYFFFFLKKLNPQYLFLKIQSIKSATCKTYCVHNSFNRTCNCQLQENTWTFWRYHATALTRKQTGWSAGVRILPRRTTWKVCTECGIGVRNTRYMDPLIHVSKEK